MNQWKKNCFCLIFAFIGVSCNLPQKSKAVIENEDAFFVAESQKISNDSQKPLEQSQYFSLIVKNIQNNKTHVIHSDQVNKRVSPASTFKIPLALMGYDSGILVDEQKPIWEYHPEYEAPLEPWKKSQGPTSWMKYSVVWYSQELTIRLGLKSFENYIRLFQYGNQDVQGNAKRGAFVIKDSTYVSFAGLINSWLGSSLKISPKEQVDFLQRLLEKKLPVSVKAIDLTKKIIYRGPLSNHYQLYGKTGTALYNLDGKNQIRILWFTGWLELNGNCNVFAANRYVTVPDSSPYFPFSDKVTEYLQNHFSEFGIQ